MGLVGTAPGRGDRVLATLLGCWLLAALLLTATALRSAWPPFGELPTVEELRHARSLAWLAGTVAVGPPAVGLVLARRWGSPGWTVAFLVGVMLAVLGAGALLSLTDAPVRGG